MDIRGKDPIPEVKDSQIHSPWGPITPEKHVQQKAQPICRDREENHELCHDNWFLQEKLSTGFAQETQACCVSTNSVQMSTGLENWEAVFPVKTQVSGDVFSTKVVALTDAAATTDSENAIRQGNLNLESNSYLRIFNPQFEGDHFETNSMTATSAFANRGPNLWDNSSRIQDGYSIPSQPTSDLKTPPRALTGTFSSRNDSSQFAPETPDQSKKAENKLTCDVHNLNRETRTRDGQRNEISIMVELNGLHHNGGQQELPKDLSSAAVSMQLTENHNPGIDQNRILHQKPRRKKHRPKVVIEGEPKRTPKPVTPKPAGKETSTGKRKYVRKKGLNQTPDTLTAEVTSGSTGQKRSPRRAKSCRRTLNFDSQKSQVIEEKSSCRPESNDNSESQAQNFYTADESNSNKQCSKGQEATVEKTEVGSGYDLSSSLDKVFEDHMSMPERQAPSTPGPTKTDPMHENLSACAQNEHIRGKCQIVFSDETHDKHGSTLQIAVNSDTQSAPKSPNDSNCSSSSCLTEGERKRGLKRGYPCTTEDAEPSCTNVIGSHYNSVCEYLAMFPQTSYNNNMIPGIHFPVVHKKNRAENGHGSITSSTLSITTAAENGVRQPTLFPLNDAGAALCASDTNCRFSADQLNTSRALTKNASVAGAQCRQRTFESNLALDQKEKKTKNRSKAPILVGSFTSLIGMAECKQLPTFSAGEAPICGGMQVCDISHRPHTCMERPVADTCAITTTKRTKRNSRASSLTTSVRRNKIPTIDAIVEYLKRLDINQGRNQQGALVLYQRDGAVVPFEGSFNPVKRRRPRPKVDLDDETNRVWKLLLENINSEGIDGTDEDKAKWWEEERRVFRGRADSFIARMHLVQGDRRFSPWKGSVVDSVVGVFLTQNVSDHLSSSAFMSLAARFPIKLKSNDRCFEETSVLVQEPEVCILNPEDTIKWHEEKSDQPTFDVEKVVSSNESHGSRSGGIKSTYNLKSKLADISGSDLEVYHTTTANKEVTSFLGEKREMDDLLSQNSAGSQNSVDSSMAQTAERKGSCLQDNLGADTATRSNPNNCDGSSFIELLQRAETLHGLYNHKIGKESVYKAEDGHPCIESSECEAQRQNKDQSDSPKISSRPIIPSSDYCLKMTHNSGVVEVEPFEMLDGESLFSDISKKIEENCTSEVSVVTAESVSQGMVQKIMTTSFQEAPKSPGECNHACSSLEGEVSNIFQSQNRTVGNPKDNTHSETQEQNHRMQQVLEAPNLSKETLDVTESTSIIKNPNTEHTEVESSLKHHHSEAINGISDTSKVKRGRVGKEKENPVNWDNLRFRAQAKGKRERTANTMDSLDWEAVRSADVNDIANTIKERGMNNMLAERIKDFLNRLIREHGSIDLEWLRDVPPDKAKEYLLSVRGLGLKSVECVRLLTLHHLAFPVDTNVGRIAVRLGWVPLRPLPESLQLHLLELYPVLESIQKYLWPRLCKLDQRTLYELHYQMITFGKVFCTKSKPNCNVCPMRGECRHFASAFASARLALPGPEEKSIVSATESKTANQNPATIIKPLQLPPPQANRQLQVQSQNNKCESIIKAPATLEPIVEVPATPEPEQQEVPDSDIEDMFCEDPEEIPTIKLNLEEFTQTLQNYMQHNMELQEGDVSKALVALTPEAASIPVPKLKNVSRLRTEHQVYELPDSHPLLDGLDKREPDDPCSYLLAIWTPGETASSIQPPERRCSSQEYGKLCDETTCFSCNSIREADSQTVRGTLLIPCRTAMRGSFPLNGTYFQVNEVFADHDSSINPIEVPRSWIWNLPRRTVYFGTSIPTIFKGLSTESIQYCFWRGFVCVRGFDQKTRAPRPLMARLHFPASKLKGKTADKQE